LHTTGYASRLARDYLGLLYGEQNSVKVSSGFITARYRFALRERFAAEVRAQLPNLLDHSAQKTRNDHRHHAFDAIFIALSDDRARMALQREWANGEKNPIPPPWEGFGADLAATLREIIPSLFFPQRDAARISGKAGAGGQRSRGQWAARGALHDETARTEEDKGSRARVHPSHGTAWHNVKENAFVMIGKNSSGELHWAAMSLWDWCDRVRVEGYVYPESFIRDGVNYQVVGVFRLHEAFKLNGQSGIWRLVNASDSEFLFVPIIDARQPMVIRNEGMAVRIRSKDGLNRFRPSRVLISPSGVIKITSSGDAQN
jgi:hypothetical protein